MQYNRVGKTRFRMSAVGFGTCQLRLVPERHAFDTLKRGFALGVKWVHTAPEYEGSDDLWLGQLRHPVMSAGLPLRIWRHGAFRVSL